MTWGSAAERILLTVWVGALWTVGYIAAPVLFANLEDRALAGALAGGMFTVVAWLSLVCGGLLLALEWRRPKLAGIRWRFWLPLAMLILIAVGEFGLRPGMEGAASADFARLHGIAQGIYLLVSLLGLGLASLGPRRA